MRRRQSFSQDGLEVLRVNSVGCQCCRKERLTVERVVSARSAEPERLAVQTALRLTLCSKCVFFHPELNLRGFVLFCFFLVVFASFLEADNLSACTKPSASFGKCKRAFLPAAPVDSYHGQHECFNHLQDLHITSRLEVSRSQYRFSLISRPG